MISVGNIIVRMHSRGAFGGDPLYAYNGPHEVMTMLRLIAVDEIMFVIGITMARQDDSPFILNVLTSAGDSGHIFIHEGIYKVVS